MPVSDDDLVRARTIVLNIIITIIMVGFFCFTFLLSSILWQNKMTLFVNRNGKRVGT